MHYLAITLFRKHLLAQINSRKCIKNGLLTLKAQKVYILNEYNTKHLVLFQNIYSINFQLKQNIIRRDRFQDCG
jgi:hypothetical protein